VQEERVFEEWGFSNLEFGEIGQDRTLIERAGSREGLDLKLNRAYSFNNKTTKAARRRSRVVKPTKLVRRTALVARSVYLTSWSKPRPQCSEDTAGKSLQVGHSNR
jgi:hypothetical protein